MLFCARPILLGTAAGCLHVIERNRVSSGVIGWYREASYQENTECSDGMGRWLTKKTQSATAVFSCRDGLESNVSMRYSVASTFPYALASNVGLTAGTRHTGRRRQQMRQRALQ